MSKHQQLYRKIGRRYVPASEMFYGEPAEGIWLVEKSKHGSSKRLIMRVGELPDAVQLAGLERHRHELSKVIRAEMNAPYSADSVAGVVLRFLASGDTK